MHTHTHTQPSSTMCMIFITFSSRFGDLKARNHASNLHLYSQSFIRLAEHNGKNYTYLLGIHNGTRIKIRQNISRCKYRFRNSFKLFVKSIVKMRWKKCTIYPFFVSSLSFQLECCNCILYTSYLVVVEYFTVSVLMAFGMHKLFGWWLQKKVHAIAFKYGSKRLHISSLLCPNSPFPSCATFLHLTVCRAHHNVIAAKYECFPVNYTIENRPFPHPTEKNTFHQFQ